MRKLLILFFATSLFVACNNNKKDDRRSDRDRDRERDDYRSRDDDRDKDSKDADYRDDRDSRDKDNNTDRDSRDSDRDKDYSSGGWTSREESKFVDDCIAEAVKNVGSRSRATDYCECMLGKLKGMYSSYEEADRELGKAGQEEINRLAADCN